MKATQAAFWERPPADSRPLEPGGAVVVMRLSPDEIAALEPFGFPAFEAIHALIAKEPRPATQSSTPDAQVTP